MKYTLEALEGGRPDLCRNDKKKMLRNVSHLSGETEEDSNSSEKNTTTLISKRNFRRNVHRLNTNIS